MEGVLFTGDAEHPIPLQVSAPGRVRSKYKQLHKQLPSAFPGELAKILVAQPELPGRIAESIAVLGPATGEIHRPIPAPLKHLQGKRELSSTNNNILLETMFHLSAHRDSFPCQFQRI